MQNKRPILIISGYSPDRYTGKRRYLDLLFYNQTVIYVNHTWNLLNLIHSKATYALRGIDMYLLYVPKILAYVIYFKFIKRLNPLLVIDSQENLYLSSILGRFSIQPDTLIFYDFGSPTGTCTQYGLQILSFNKVVVMTDYIAQCLIEQLGNKVKSKIQVIPYKVDGEWLTVQKTDLRLPDRFLLFVGSEQDRKNLFSVLFAFEKILIENPTFYFIKVGTHQSTKNRVKLLTLLNQKPHLKEKFMLIEDVSYTNLAAIYQRAFLLVFPSTYEGFGVPLVEAMTKNIPILASDIPTTREICADAAEYITEPFNIELWYKAIIRFITDKKYYQNMSSKAGERSQQFIIK